jgi:hypothetical protein
VLSVARHLVFPQSVEAPLIRLTTKESWANPKINAREMTAFASTVPFAPDLQVDLLQAGREAGRSALRVPCGDERSVDRLEDRLGMKLGQQEKHFPGHPNFQLGRSAMAENPERLIERAGSGTPAGFTARGLPGFKERVDFQDVIGMWVPREGGDPMSTTIGMLHYGSRGIHIVPARP